MKPDRNADMVKSMIAHARQSVHGMLPVWSLMGNENWCMSGYHGVSAVSDALVKDVLKGETDEASRRWSVPLPCPTMKGWPTT